MTSRILHRLATGILPLVATGCVGAVAAGTESVAPLPSLMDRLDALVEEAPFDGVQWGILVVDPANGRRLYERNADVRFIPASNAKIPVVVAAFGELGPEFRWETTFFARGLPLDGRLEGDLYLFGEGDPSLGAPFFDPPEAALSALADSLVGVGVREVTGRLVVDASVWDSTSVPPSWMVEDLNGAYAATGGPFSIRSGELEIEVRGAERAGLPGTVVWTPSGTPTGSADRPGFVEHAVRTVEVGDLDAEPELVLGYRPESRRWRVEGEIGTGEVRRFSRSARDPVRLATAALARSIADAGIRIEGGTEVLWDRDLPLGSSCATGRIPGCAETLRIAGMASPPLSEIAEAILGPSQNWMTEQLVRTLGAERGDEGSWQEGFRVIQEHLEIRADLDRSSMHLADGSGLSTQNLLSPGATVRLLRYSRLQPWGRLFHQALARPGAEGTTLEDRLPGLEGRLFAKTGTLTHVNALSGYVVTDAGRELIFSVLTNASNLPASVMRDRIDALIEEIAQERGTG